MAKEGNSLSWFDDFKRAYADGLAMSGEDRRELLTALREMEGRAEAPRAVYTLFQNPLLDVVRQHNTFNNSNVLGLPQMTDDALVLRGNSGMLAGVKPEEIITDKSQWFEGQALPPDPVPRKSEDPKAFEIRTRDARLVRERNLETYKKALAKLPVSTKAGQALGNLTSDFVQNNSRNLWWLVNASQAVADLASEGAASLTSPDLFSGKRLNDLDRAVQEGDLRYVDRPLSQEEKQLDDFAQIDIESARRKDPGNYVQASPGVYRARGHWKKRMFNPNLVNAAVMLPAAAAINSGVGLMGGTDAGIPIPGLGRREGYAAAVPSEDDARKTENALAEVATRYILSREGKLLPWSEFAKERVDVSKQQYNDYISYERDRDLDLNPFDDGKFNVAGGVLKGTSDGIHGAELQFLGKNIPVNEALLPTAGAIGATVLAGLLPNARRLRKRKNNPSLSKFFPKDAYDKSGEVKFGAEKVNKYQDKNASPLTKFFGEIPEVMPRDVDGNIQRNPNIKNPALESLENFFTKSQRDENGKLKRDEAGKVLKVADTPDKGRVLGSLFGAGTAGFIGAGMLGSNIEDERRRRNFEENRPGLDYDLFKQNAAELAERKVAMVKANPNRKEERADSKVGFNARAYQSSLMDSALEQQVLVDQIVNEDKQIRAQSALNESQKTINKAQSIEEEIRRRREGIKDTDDQANGTIGF